MNEIPMQPIVSSNIAAIGYEPRTNTLRVEFKGGKTADYYGVYRGTYDQFRASTSPGSFFSTEIRNRYAWSYI